MLKFLFFWILLVNTVFQFSGLYLDGTWTFLAFSILPASFTYLWRDLFKLSKMKTIVDFYFWLLLIAGPFATPGGLFLLFVPLKSQYLESFKTISELKVEFQSAEKLEYKLIQNFWSENSEKMIEPFIDIMKADNQAKKRSTIDKVVQHPGSYSKPILQLGLQDSNPEINFYSASGLILLNDRFMEDIKELEKIISLDSKAVKEMLTLASIYTKYSEWGFAEKKDAPAYRFKTATLYNRILNIDKENETAIEGLSQVLLKEDMESSAYYILKQHPAKIIKSAKLIESFMQILLRKRHFAELILFCKKALQSLSDSEFEKLGLDISLKQSIKYWAKVSSISQLDTEETITTG